VPFYRIESLMETQAGPDGAISVVPVIRIVSFFEDTVSKIANVLLNEFEITPIKSVDKNGGTWLDSFSSQQVHYLAGLKANRLELSEYKGWGAAKFEVRVSSMLQDVWSGMEKELTSGGTNPIPEVVKRDFYRIGAFLEMADVEFLKIRNQISSGTATNGAGNYHDYMATPAQPILAHNTAQPTITDNAQLNIAPNTQDATRIDSIDMSVDSFNSLAVSVNNIENKNGEIADKYSDLIKTNINTDREATSTAPAPSNTDAQVPVEVSAPNAAAPAPDGVALNIDNVENFNLNVNGMIERTTEIIREGSSSDRNGPSFEEDKSAPPVIVDENAQMTDATLREYVVSSKLLKEIDQMIADRAGAKVNDEIDIEGDVERLRFLKVFSLKQLQEKLNDNKPDIVAFAEKWIGKDNGGSFDSGISLFYLEYLLVGKKNDPAFAVEYVLKFISDNDYSARYIIPTYNSIRQTETATNFAHLTLK